jgi:hypothetical protein
MACTVNTLTLVKDKDSGIKFCSHIEQFSAITTILSVLPVLLKNFVALLNEISCKSFKHRTDLNYQLNEMRFP